ncbi:unnamed protein product [Mycena citricolor]|uniref:F-box domain-containing protein n=1 Tax=Mycena citricolor TaxID=2018698 RepID=A0AAD2HVG6_9AGAR|nr:unnamed protein product [Mycena citricolor]
MMVVRSHEPPSYYLLSARSLALRARSSRALPLPMSQLPVEIWDMIIQNVPQHHRPTLLGVSRLFHEIALRSVFSTVKIFLVHGEPGLLMLNTESERYVEDVSDHRFNESWDILHCIITNPLFASVVRTMSVHAFTDGPAIFEQRTVAQALRAMPHLQSFHYFGDCPDVSAIVSALPKQLERLRIQFTPSSSLFGELSNLRNFQPAIPFSYVQDQQVDGIFSEWNYGFGRAEDAMEIVNGSPNIREVTLLPDHLPLLSVRVCHMLTTLDICVPQGYGELVGLELVFRHAVALTSLSLVGYMEPQAFEVIPRDVSALPSLTSFRLSCESWDPDSTTLNLPYISDFLESRQSLRRLHLRLPDIRVSLALGVFAIISKMRGLQVLGFHVGCLETFDGQCAELLASGLSLKLTALQLVLPWRGDLHLKMWTPILSKLQRCPRLTFVHLFSCGEDPVPIHPDELAADLEHLELVGLQRSLFTIRRDAEKHYHWRPWSVKYCIPEDFPSVDHAWLFQYH